jgi:hypothetical protein
MTWRRVRKCLLLNNCWSISLNTSYFSMIAPSSTKSVPMFNVQMTPTLVVGPLKLFPLWVLMLAFFGWLIQRSFTTIPPFPNLLQSLSSRAPSHVVAPIWVLASRFNNSNHVDNNLIFFSSTLETLS